MINLELSPGHQNITNMIHGMAKTMIRPLARKYDTQEHEPAVELENLAKMMDKMGGGMGDMMGGKKEEEVGEPKIKNGGQKRLKMLSFCQIF